MKCKSMKNVKTETKYYKITSESQSERNLLNKTNNWKLYKFKKKKKKNESEINNVVHVMN